MAGTLLSLGHGYSARALVRRLGPEWRVTGTTRSPEKADALAAEGVDALIAFMKELKQPWIAFKVMAAGAITPEDGFRYAFENGADFICVGMFDFQIVDDVNITIDTLNHLQGRKRGWYS